MGHLFYNFGDTTKPETRKPERPYFTSEHFSPKQKKDSSIFLVGGFFRSYGTVIFLGRARETALPRRRRRKKKIFDVELQLVPEQDFSFFEIAPDLVR